MRLFKRYYRIGVPFAPLFAAALSLAILSSCGSTGKRAAAADEAKRSSRTADPGQNASAAFIPSPPVSAAPVPGDADTEAIAGPDSIPEDPAYLIDLAKADCSEGNYAAADSNLKKAIRAIEDIDAWSDSGREEWFPSSNYLDEIITMYKEKMPASYSIPDDIAMTELQRFMVRSLDSIKLMPPESLSIAAMKCLKDAVYDVPMVWNERVQRALNFYIRNRRTTIDLWFDRARHYLPTMRNMFAERGLPPDLAYLPLIESGFNPLAYSFAQASGIWQFIASTGKLYGLRRSFWLDERRDPIRSTEAAIAYLKKLHGDFGDWHLALAAYNCGENGVARCIARHKTADYWRLKRLPAETRSYVPFYLAAVTIAKNPKCFGIVPPKVAAVSFDTVRINDCISLADIAAGIGVAPEMLKKLNPHIMRWCTPPDAANTLLYLPAGAKKAWHEFYAHLPPEKLVRWTRIKIKRGDNIPDLERQYNLAAGMLQSINRLAESRLAPGRHLFIPVTDAPLSGPISLSPPPEDEIKSLDISDYEFSGRATRYRVRKGDNLSRIARRYHTTVSRLCRWNRISGKTVLRPGRILIVSKPLPPEPAAAPAPVAIAPKPRAAIDTTAMTGMKRIVRQGDTPFSIAREEGVTLNDLISWNSLDPVRPVIHPGDTITIPQPGTAPAPEDTTLQAVSLAAGTTETATPESILTVKTGSTPESGHTTWSDAGRSDSAIQKADQIPVAAATAAVPPIETEHSRDTSDDLIKNHVYIIQPGENLFRISKKFSIPLAALLTCNGLHESSIIHAGDTLSIPSPAAADMAVRKKEGPLDAVYYRIKQGDTLLRIAAAFGVTIEDISRNNNLKPTAFLVPGKMIIIKAGG